MIMMFNMQLVQFLLLLVSCGIFSIVSANCTNTSDEFPKRRLTNVDLMAEGLKELQWEEEDLPCLNIMLQGLSNSSNLTLWAFWMLDSMQIPVGQLYGSTYHVGNYDECMEPPWLDNHPKYKTQYCVAEVQLAIPVKNSNVVAADPEGSPKMYIETLTKHGRDLAKMYWSICVPSICQRVAISNIYRTLMQNSHWSSYSEKAHFEIASCEIAGETKVYTTEFYVYILILVFLFTFGCWCSYYTKKYYDHNTKSYIQETVRSFYFKRNIDSLTNTKDDEIYIMNIMRVATSFFIVYGHLGSFIFGRMISNGQKIESFIDSDYGLTAKGNVLVETFFVLSGLLLIRGFKKGTWKNPIKFLFKRYMRLIGGILIISYYFKYMHSYLGDGPFWEKFGVVEKNICDLRLWDNIAMISNYWSETLACFPVGWFVSTDYQLTIMGVIICYIYGKNKRFGYSAYIICFVLTIFMAGVTQYVSNIPTTQFYGIESAVDGRTNIFFTAVNNKTHIRSDSFMIGMAMGYYIALYDPAKYRKVVSMKWSYIMLIGSLLVMIGVVYSGKLTYLHPHRLLGAVFVATHRIAWAVGIATIIYVYEYGNLGLDEIFKWPPLVLLGRLTYGVYIIHSALVERYLFSIRTPYKWDLFEIFVKSLGMVVVSTVLSFMLWLIVEGPLQNLTALCLDGIKPKKAEKSVPVSGNSALLNEDAKKKEN